MAEPARRMTIKHIHEQLDTILDEVRRIHGAFPHNEIGEADIEGHRKYHEAMIESAKAQTEFWRELRLEIAKKGAWALVMLVIGLVFTGVLAKLGFAVVTASATTPIGK